MFRNLKAQIPRQQHLLIPSPNLMVVFSWVKEFTSCCILTFCHKLSCTDPVRQCLRCSVSVNPKNGRNLHSLPQSSGWLSRKTKSTNFFVIYLAFFAFLRIFITPFKVQNLLLQYCSLVSFRCYTKSVI